MAVLGGHVDAANSNPGQVMQFVEAQKLRVLGVMGEKRLPGLPDVPAYDEAGFPVEAGWDQFQGIFGRKEIPESIQEKISREKLRRQIITKRPPGHDHWTFISYHRPRSY